MDVVCGDGGWSSARNRIDERSVGAENAETWRSCWSTCFGNFAWWCWSASGELERIATNGISLRREKRVDDVERESIGFDVKSVEFALNFVVGGGAVPESEGAAVFNIRHAALL